MPTLIFVGNLGGRSVLSILALLFLVSRLAMADSGPEKKRVGIKLAEERWITLTDGTRVTQGKEISYLLANQLFEHPLFTPILLDESPVQIDLRVTPKIETLLYASGSRSNRLVFGFAPDRENIFNSGREGSFDNEFVATGDQASQCIKPDFFEGRFDVQSWGPFKSNFGANLDEGFVISIAGYGLGFKQKKFEIKNQIRFTVEDIKAGTSRDLVFDVKGSGKDVFIMGNYAGFSLGLEIQRRETLLEGLKKILPLIVDGLVKEGLEKKIDSSQKELVFSQEVEIPVSHTERALAQTKAMSACLSQSGDWLEDTVEGLMSLYALWRYKTVLDQPLKSKINAQNLNSHLPRIALIDSGIDYNDKKIGRHVIRVGEDEALGFDFIAWDHRPSDDNGHGTAAAKYFLEKIKSDYSLIPVKVLGAYGDTHSAAIYDAFTYAVSQKVDAIVVPWAPTSKLTEAYKRGAQLAAEKGIAVFVAPRSMAPGKNIFMPTENASEAFKTKGLGGTQLQLPADGVAVVDMFSRWLKIIGGPNNDTTTEDPDFDSEFADNSLSERLRGINAVQRERPQRGWHNPVGAQTGPISGRSLRR
jgi:hypothetical protein